MGCDQKAIRCGFTQYTCPQETEAERGRTQGYHRGREAALGGIPKVAGALIQVIRSARQTKFLEAEFP